MHHDVGGLRENFFGVARNFDAPRRVARANDFSEVAADFGRICVNGSDNFNGLLLPQQLGDGGANRPDAVLNRANLLFHLSLRVPDGEPINAIRRSLPNFRAQGNL